jgi:hypothetical protein
MNFTDGFGNCGAILVADIERNFGGTSSSGVMNWKKAVRGFEIKSEAVTEQMEEDFNGIKEGGDV